MQIRILTIHETTKYYTDPRKIVLDGDVMFVYGENYRDSDRISNREIEDLKITVEVGNTAEEALRDDIFKWSHYV